MAEYGRVTRSASPQRSRYKGLLSFPPPPVQCRDLGSLPEADQATGVVSSMLLALHPWHQMARPHVKRRSLQESQPAKHTVQLMEDTCMPKVVFFSQLQERKHDRCAPSRCYKDQLKRHLAQAGISHQSWQQVASYRDSWHSSVIKASCEFEAARHKAAKEKRRRQKEQAASLPSSSQTFICPKCGTGCASRISLCSHQQACRN